MITRLLILTSLLGFATVSGCIFPGVYKLNVQQGNIITQEMIDKLRPGMTHRQVIYVMGNPVLSNPFNENRWDYTYTLEQNDKITTSYRISLYFNEQQRYTHYTGRLPSNEPTTEVDQQIPDEQSDKNNLPDSMYNNNAD